MPVAAQSDTGRPFRLGHSLARETDGRDAVVLGKGLRKPGMIGVERNPDVLSLGSREDRPGDGSGAHTHPGAEFPHGQELGQRDHSIDHRVPEQHAARGNSASALVRPLAFDLPVNHGSELVEQAEGDGVGDNGGSLLSQLHDVAPQTELLNARPRWSELLDLAEQGV